MMMVLGMSPRFLCMRRGGAEPSAGGPSQPRGGPDFFEGVLWPPGVSDGPWATCVLSRRGGKSCHTKVPKSSRAGWLRVSPRPDARGPGDQPRIDRV